MKIFTERLQRGIAGILAAVVLLSTVLTDFPVFDAWGDMEYYPGMTMLSGSEDWKFFCIDSYELLHEAGGVQGTNEWYAYVVPSTRLSDEEVAILFWATLSLRAGKEGAAECTAALDKINAAAPSAGLPQINPRVTEADLKTIIHLQSTRDKYSWLNPVLANEDTYLEMAGLLGSSATSSAGGKPIPAILQNHTDVTAALPIDSSTFTLSFDPSGADKEFIHKVPLKFSIDGSAFEALPVGGWTYQKTDTGIIFSNPDPQPSKLLIQFDTAGTEYQVGAGYASVQEAYDKALQLWVCIECNDRHVYHSQKKLPLEAHQRLVYLETDMGQQQYYASIFGSPTAGSTESGSIQFKVYRHEEDMKSTYNVQLYKYDHETGKPLENSVFKLYERFDDQDEIDKERDGPVHIYEGGEPYKSYHTDNPVIWNGFRFISGLSTDKDGYASKTVSHGYHYDKTFCDGHPAPQFVVVPEEEEEEDEETGEAAVANEAEIEAAQAENKRLAQSWIGCYEACEAHASGDFDGVHFHWLMPEVDMGAIESILSSGGDPGETPDAGKTTSAEGEESYRESGCEEDCRLTYDKFISLRYSYTFVESKARDGYIRHDLHADDLPIEVITTDSSENGANSAFANAYSADIDINDQMNYALADETLAARERAAAYQLSPDEFGQPEQAQLLQKPENYHQEIIRLPMAATATDSDAEEAWSGRAGGSVREEWDDGEAWSDEVELIDDVNGEELATPSAATFPEATPSDASLATPSAASYHSGVIFSKSHNSIGTFTDDSEDTSDGQSGVLFQTAYNEALSDASTGPEVDAGPSGNYSHCNDSDGEGNAWRIYDHRTEGEIHINKRDMELEEGETTEYDSYGDAQGDGTLEGAVYGLFAAEDIIHPDGRTGVVYQANNLVAVAATDRNGDASFLVNTEMPGCTYHYETGKIIRAEGGWTEASPQNLYVDNISFDDYSQDNAYERVYSDNREINGNCWIGRPLILGSYYIKELTRSEGYELSIGNRDSSLTNRGQDHDAALPVGTGYANISRGLYAEGQISSAPDGSFGNPDIDELFFTAESRGTAGKGFDLVFHNIPDGAKFYRLDTGKEFKEVEKGTGIYDKVYLTNGDGTPRYVVAEHDYQYPKYNTDGSLMTAESPINYRANQIPVMQEKPLDAEKTLKSILSPEAGMSEAQVASKLEKPFSMEDKNFLKAKTERALRANGRRTPKKQSNGKTIYSSIHAGIYDQGVRKGEPDETGLSGVAPGELAAATVYGAPLVTLEIPALREDGSPVSTGDFILTVLDYYNSNSFYGFGGIHEISVETGGADGAGDIWNVAVYASCPGGTGDFFVPGNDAAGGDGTIFHRIPYLPDDSGESPRYVYAVYVSDSSADAFGTYEDYRGEMIGGTYFASATLVTDALALGDGTLVSKTVTQNVYYQTGEIPRDETGKQIRAFEYREQTVKTVQEVEVYFWEELFSDGERQPAALAVGAEKEKKGNEPIVVHIDSSYTDSYGNRHDDAKLQAYSLRIVLPRREITLTPEDINEMQVPDGWISGDQMGSASYYLNVKQAKVKVYLNYADLNLTGDSSFVKRADLIYPGEDDVWQDGAGRPGTNTRSVPVAVQERAIKQKVKITKTIDRDSYQGTNTYAEVHEDWFTRLFAQKGNEAQKAGNFRFKVYLKSNLERLYRDEEGRVEWMDRNGNLVDIASYLSAYPEKVPKIYTKVPHSPDIRKNSEDAVTANQELYSYSNGLIHDEQNMGYTSILETTGRVAQNDGGGTRVIEVPNYEKFFDAIRTANTDRWDNPRSRDREFTGWDAWDAVRNAWEDKIDPAVQDTSYKPFARIRPGVFSASTQSQSGSPAALDGKETKNERNTGAEAKKNAMSSDAVRQFAITWYLDEEVKKLVQDNGDSETEGIGGSLTYPDETYDRTLAEAIDKANHYLTPFFLYDLDSIYAIAWDGEPGGGKDGDPATLCADELEDGADGYYYGVSAYLPYGIYVAVEQQPYNHKKGQYDFVNRHYKTDTPKEILLPTVYEPGGETDSPETYADSYRYQSAMTPEETAAAYQIRFHEEWAKNHTDDIRGYVIRAHNADGDFEVYKYGLDLDRLTGTAGERPYEGWKVTQDTYDPVKDYYNDPLADTKEGGGNPDSHYFADDQSGDKVETYYHYASVSEHGRTRDGVRIPCGRACGGDCLYGVHFRDQVWTMEGELTAYEGLYAPMLVPWTVQEPAGGEAYAGAMFRGYADRKFCNTFYSTKLRIEKLDSETGESILHDQALFAIYAAERDDSETGEGRVKFYEKPTVISGSKAFLEAMGAKDLNPRARGIVDPDLAEGALWYGTVPAGTPVCRESEQIVLKDTAGNQTGEFYAFSTMRDGKMKAEPNLHLEPRGLITADQNTGYLKLPQPLGAGVYVLAEIKPPSGYVRSKPIAVEIYSDRVTYYLDGDRDHRVAAAICEEEQTQRQAEEITLRRNAVFSASSRRPAAGQARIYVGNTPVRLEVSKKKTDDQTVTYRVSGRVEGSITELEGRYGLENLELAYNASGTYLGYGWHKGTAESLAARKASGEAVEMIYEDGVFSGYANVTRPLLTVDDTNRYVAGAVLTLYDAIPVRRNGDSQDYAYDGVVVERDRNSNVTRMYVRQGYAGTKTELVRKTFGTDAFAAAGPGVWGGIRNVGRDSSGDEHWNGNRDGGQESSGDGIWTYQTVRRPDTDILYYDLGNLSVLSRDNRGSLWSYDKEGKPMRIVDGVTESIYALQNKQPVFELAGGDFTELRYDPMAKAFTGISPDTVIYHLDKDGQRDAMVDSYTGMAYLTTAGTEPDAHRPESVMVWPVTVIKDHDGSILAKHKIKTSRIASVHADTDQEYISGTYSSEGAGSFEKYLNPVLDQHGQVEYYQSSGERYEKSAPVYDRDGDFIYDRYSDHLTAFNDDAYIVKEPGSIFDKGQLWDASDNRDERLYMREGDHYILENTWVSGDKTPNDPFDTEPTAGQADMLKRVVPGSYIMEEIKPPEGYAKAFPVCVTVEESDQVQRTQMVDETIKIEISKIDAPEDFRQTGVGRAGANQGNMHQGSAGRDRIKNLRRTEPKGAYTYLPVAGAELALFHAKKIATSDYEAFPDGWYLVKTGNQPATWTGTDGKNNPVTCTARWTSADSPFYLEGIPSGYYILEELQAPSGYVRSTAWLEIKETGEVQTFQIKNDHTKLEIFKYQTVDGKKTALPNSHAARLGLFPAVTDEGGRPVMENGSPLYQEESPVEIWKTDDCRQYTALTDLSVYQKWGLWARIKAMFGAGRPRYSGFEHDYEKMYREYGAGFDELHWFYTDEPYDGTGELPNLREGTARLKESHEADQSGCVTQIWQLEDGREIRITVSPDRNPLTGEAFFFEYQYHYRKLTGNMVSYDTRDGCHRIDYIPWNQSNGVSPEHSGSAAYVLAEVAAPEGYQPAKPKVIMVHETTGVQMYEMENRPEPDKPKPPPEESRPEETTEPETTPPDNTETETTVPQTEPETPDKPTEPETSPPQTEPEVPPPSRPGTPDGGEETPAPPETWPPLPVIVIGRITANYDGGALDGGGREGWYRRDLSRTGDFFPRWLWMALLSVSGVGIMIMVRRRREDEKETKTRGGPSGRSGKGKTDQSGPDRAVGAYDPASDGNCQMPRGKGGDGSRKSFGADGPLRDRGDF